MSGEFEQPSISWATHVPTVGGQLKPERRCGSPIHRAIVNLEIAR
jgi:hypothetical protein